MEKISGYISFVGVIEYTFINAKCLGGHSKTYVIQNIDLFYSPTMSHFRNPLVILKMANWEIIQNSKWTLGLIFAECPHFLHKMHFLHRQLHPNQSIEIRFLKQNYFYTVTSLCGLYSLPYVTLCHLFGQSPSPKRITYFLNGLLDKKALWFLRKNFDNNFFRQEKFKHLYHM